MSFTRDDILSVLRDRFHIQEFRRSQEEIILRTLEGKNSLVLMPTGMGKSLCYQLPALMLDGLTVVISPLISLMKDQVDKLCAQGIDAAFVNSSLGRGERENRYDNIAKGRYTILFVSPERFRKNDFVEVLCRRKVSLLAVDEAHCVSQWGHDFRPDYACIKEFREIAGNPVTIALTATATESVQKDILEKIGIENDIRIFNEGVCRPNLHLSVRYSFGESEKFEQIYEELLKNRGNTIVYFNLISSIERFSSFLDIQGMRYSVYHGKLAPDKRRRVQNDFLRSRNIIMLATNAFGMGVDKPDIRQIIHAELPDSIESYYQEIGRAGRDGSRSDCILFYDQSDLAVQMDFLKWKNPDPVFIKNTYQLIASLGERLVSATYEDLQEKLVFKNRGDHRLQTVLSIFDRYGVTEGSLDTFSLRLASSLPEELVSEEIYSVKENRDRQRLVDVVEYAKSTKCRREIVHRYFSMPRPLCGSCDNCRQESF